MLKRTLCLAVALYAAPVRAQCVAAGCSTMPDPVRSYIHDAMAIFRTRSVHRTEVDWASLEDSVFARSAKADSPSGTYEALTWALRRVDRHSFLVPPPDKVPASMTQAAAAARPVPRAGAATTAVDPRVGIVAVGEHGGPNRVPYVDSIHSRIASLDSAGVYGWIVDLRNNGGGNMWPMLAGVGPLLGADVVGSFADSQPGIGWHYREGRSWAGGDVPPIQVPGWGTNTPHPVRNPLAPVALLIGKGTKSSGEMTLLAFLGRPNVRTFGDSTGGYTSVNASIPLRDGATMVVTTSYPRDRLGRRYPLSVAPDKLVAATDASGKDAQITRAMAWVLQQPGCRAR